MQTFKQFLADDIMDMSLLIKLINARADKTPKLRLYCDYDGALHEGFVEDAQSNNEFSMLVNYKTWREDEHAYIPATLFIYAEDVGRFYFGKDYDAKQALLCRPEGSIKEEREIYAKKIEGAPEWSPAHAEGSYKVGPITFSASDGLGSVPLNRNIWHEGVVVLMKPSVFMQLAHDDQGAQEPTSFELEKLVGEGYAVGIPFISIQIDEKGEKLPKVTGHEGRGRMRMIRRLLGDEPVPVHVKLDGGIRSSFVRDNPEVAAEIKQGLFSQSGALIRRPVSKVWVSMDGRNNEPGVPY